MLRKLLLVPWLAVAVVMSMTTIASAQYDQASVYSVPGQVLRVIYDRGSYTEDGRLVYYDQVLARFYAPDRRLRQDWSDAPSSGGNRPVTGDRLT